MQKIRTHFIKSYFLTILIIPTLHNFLNNHGMIQALPISIQTSSVVQECAENGWEVCCYPNNQPVWKKCFQNPQYGLQTKKTSSCEYIKDDNGTYATIYNKDVIKKESIIRPSIPRNLKITPIFANGKAALGNISWTFPLESIARNLRGFLLEVVWDGGKKHSWVFLVDGSQDDDVIWHTCTRLYPYGNYKITVTSLPGNEAISINNYNLIKNSYSLKNTPSQCDVEWRGLIRNITLNSTKICFFAAPARDNFQSYKIFINYKNDEEKSVKKWNVDISNVSEAEFKVYCQNFELEPANYNAVVIAKLEGNKECNCEGGCSYYLNFQVPEKKIKELLFTPTLNKSKGQSILTNHTTKPHITSLPNYLVVITTATIIPLVLMLVIFCISLYLHYGALKRFLKSLVSKRLAVLVADMGSDKDIEKKILKLSEIISSRCSLNVKSVLLKTIETKGKKNIFKAGKDGEERYTMYILKGGVESAVKAEEVLSLIEKADHLLLVHSKSSCDDIRTFINSNEESKSGVITRINLIYEHDHIWRMNLRRKIFDEEARDEGTPEDDFKGIILPPRCHISLDGSMVLVAQEEEAVFQVMQDMDKLFRWIQKPPEKVEMMKDWIPPKEDEVLDRSIKDINFELMNKEYDRVVDGEEGGRAEKIDNSRDDVEKKNSLDSIVNEIKKHTKIPHNETMDNTNHKMYNNNIDNVTNKNDNNHDTITADHTNNNEDQDVIKSNIDNKINNITNQ